MYAPDDIARQHAGSMINQVKPTWGAPMMGLANDIKYGVCDGSAEAIGNAPMARLAWLVGLLSTMYLIGNALLLLFLAVGFANYTSADFAWYKVADIGLFSMPVIVFAAVGFAGLKLWPRGRFRLLGLLAIVFQTAMASWVYADPIGVIDVVFSGHLS